MPVCCASAPGGSDMRGYSVLKRAWQGWNIIILKKIILKIYTLMNGIHEIMKRWADTSNPAFDNFESQDKHKY